MVDQYENACTHRFAVARSIRISAGLTNSLGTKEASQVVAGLLLVALGDLASLCDLADAPCLRQGKHWIQIFFCGFARLILPVRLKTHLLRAHINRLLFFCHYLLTFNNRLTLVPFTLDIGMSRCTFKVVR